MAVPKRPIVESPGECPGWLTRNEACDLLGVSHEQLRRWETEGRLHPRETYTGRRPALLYDPKELSKMPTIRRVREQTLSAGEICARAFECFERNLTTREIVIELRQPVEVIEAHFAQWLEAGGERHVLTDKQRALLAEIVGDFDTTAELVERVHEFADAHAATTTEMQATHESDA